MKPVLTKIAVLLPLVLLVAIVNFAGGGTASAAQRSANTPAHSACGWTGQNFLAGSVEGFKWTYTCNGGVHCEAVDNGYVGNVTVTIEAYNSSGQLASNLSTSGYFTGRGQALNTDTVPRGYSLYICSVDGPVAPTPAPASTEPPVAPTPTSSV